MGGIELNLIPSVTSIPEAKMLQTEVSEGKRDLFESMLKEAMIDHEERSLEAKNRDEKASDDKAVTNIHSSRYLLQSSLSASLFLTEKEQKEKNANLNKNEFVLKQIKKAYGDF